MDEARWSKAEADEWVDTIVETIELKSLKKGALEKLLESIVGSELAGECPIFCAIVNA
jgi:hypothetical protein